MNCQQKKKKINKKVGVVNNVPRTATIVAATNVDLIVLSRKSLDEVVKKYPECHKIILLEAEKRYKIVQKRVEKDNKKKYKLERKEYVKKQKRNSKDKSNVIYYLFYLICKYNKFKKIYNKLLIRFY